MTAERILTRNFDRPDAHTLRRYRETGGYTAIEKARAMEPAAIADTVLEAIRERRFLVLPDAVAGARMLANRAALADGNPPTP